MPSMKGNFRAALSLLLLPLLLPSTPQSSMADAVPEVRDAEPSLADASPAATTSQPGMLASLSR